MTIIKIKWSSFLIELRLGKSIHNYTKAFRQLGAGILPGSSCLTFLDNVGDCRNKY